MNLLKRLQEEKQSRLKGGLYHQTQIKLAYNTNRIEGSKLSEEQTRYIYETNTLVTENGDTTADIDDIVETLNHFTCFDYMLDCADEALSETHIKTFHRLLKNNTSDAKKAWFKTGDYKTQPNTVGGMETTLPAQVPTDMQRLLDAYHEKETVTFEDIVDFHFHFERIHPFQDGNGRVGRLIMFKECLAHGIPPLIIKDDLKFYYYRGLKEYPTVKDFLTDTCRSAQDNYKRMTAYFFPDFDSFEG